MSDVPVKPLGSQVDLRHVYHVPDDTFPENRSLPDKSISLRTVLRLMAVTIATVTVVLGLTIGVVVWTALKVWRLDETGSPDTLSMVETENRSVVSTSACGTNESSVVFSAKKPWSIDVALGTPIVFTKEVTNIGGGYNALSGKFTAPRSGTYLFHTSVCSWVGKWVYVHLMAKEQPLATTGVRDLAVSGSCTSVTGIAVLSRGESAWVEGAWDETEALYTANGYSLPSFTGVLLQRKD